MSKKYSPEELFELASPGGGRYAVQSIQEAHSFCMETAGSHYENFPVGSVLIPAEERPHVFAVYAFSRVADDISDELTDYSPEKRIKLLNGMKKYIVDCDEDTIVTNPIYLAVRDTMEKKGIPAEPFCKLTDAFIMDINFRQPRNFADLEYYCGFSANPVGELILRIFGQYNPVNAGLSDKICTGLQLVNFWQDLSQDMKIGRFYLPEDLLNKYKITQNNIQFPENQKKVEKILNEIYDYSENFFKIGMNLVEFLEPLRLKLEIAVTIEGGLAVLNKSRQLKAEILHIRPRINKIDFVSILIRSLFKYRVIF